MECENVREENHFEKRLSDLENDEVVI